MNALPVDQKVLPDDDRAMQLSIEPSVAPQGAASISDRECARSQVATALLGLLAMVFLGTMIGLIVGAVSGPRSQGAVEFRRSAHRAREYGDSVLLWRPRGEVTRHLSLESTTKWPIQMRGKS
jgi:hypothetical protein